MIVKDEENNIRGTIENIVQNCKIDYWVISDTGSTDNTIQIIRETFENQINKLLNKHIKSQKSQIQNAF